MCPNCKAHTSLSAEPWHFFICKRESKGEIDTRHNDVADAIYHTVLAVGGQAFREPLGLEAGDGRRPDLHLRVNLQTIIVTWWCRTRSALATSILELPSDPWARQRNTNGRSTGSTTALLRGIMRRC